MSSIWAMRRDTAGGKVGGVCAGLARQADVDPVLVRVAAVLLALSGGIGLVVYAAVWLFTADERGRVPVDEHFPAARRWPRGARVAAIVVACVVAAVLLDGVLPFTVGPALVVAAIWYFGYYRHQRAESGWSSAPPPGLPPGTTSYPTFSGPVTPFTEAAAAWQRRVEEMQRYRRAEPNPVADPGPRWPEHDPDPSAAPGRGPGWPVHGPNSHDPDPLAAPGRGPGWPEHDPDPLAAPGRGPGWPVHAANPWAAPGRGPGWPVHDPNSHDPDPLAAPGRGPGWPVHDPSTVSAVREPVGEPLHDPSSVSAVRWPVSEPAYQPAPDPHAAYLAQPDPVGLYVDPPAPAVLPPHRRVAARRLRLVSVVVLGLVLAGLAVADAAGAPIGVTSYLAAALLVGGLTLIGAAWLGRARGILPLTLLVALAGLGSAGATQAHLGDWGERVHAYTAQSAMPTADTLAGGSMSIDLSELPVTRDQSYTATMDYGQLELTRPRASNVRVVWSVDRGLVTLPGGETQSARALTGSIEPTGVQPGDPVLTVTLHVGRGALEVR